MFWCYLFTKVLELYFHSFLWNLNRYEINNYKIYQGESSLSVSWNKLNMFVSQLIPKVKCSTCYGVGVSGTAKTCPKSLSTQTTHTLITTAIYWCLLMQLAISSHQFHKPEKASIKLYIVPIYFVLLILPLHEWKWNIVDKAQLQTSNCYAAFELSKYSSKSHFPC